MTLRNDLLPDGAGRLVSFKNIYAKDARNLLAGVPCHCLIQPVTYDCI